LSRFSEAFRASQRSFEAGLKALAKLDPVEDRDLITERLVKLEEDLLQHDLDQEVRAQQALGRLSQLLASATPAAGAEDAAVVAVGTVSGAAKRSRPAPRREAAIADSDADASDVAFLVANYCLRRGYLKTFDALVDPHDRFLHDVEEFTEATATARAIRGGDASAVLRFCDAHASKLAKLRSTLRAETRRRAFCDTRSEGDASRVAHARALATERDPAVDEKAMMMSILLREEWYSPRTAAAANDDAARPRATSFATTVDEPSSDSVVPDWEDLAEVFLAEHARVLNLSSPSSFEVLLAAGVAAHKTARCGGGGSSSSASGDGGHRDCPCCSRPFAELAKTLPLPQRLHTTVVDPCTRRVVDAAYALADGCVVSRATLEANTNRETGMYVDPNGSREPCPAQRARRAYFI